MVLPPFQGSTLILATIPGAALFALALGYFLPPLSGRTQVNFHLIIVIA